MGFLSYIFCCCFELFLPFVSLTYAEIVFKLWLRFQGKDVCWHLNLMCMGLLRHKRSEVLSDSLIRAFFQE